MWSATIENDSDKGRQKKRRISLIAFRFTEMVKSFMLGLLGPRHARKRHKGTQELKRCEVHACVTGIEKSEETGNKKRSAAQRELVVIEGVAWPLCELPIRSRFLVWFIQFVLPNYKETGESMFWQRIPTATSISNTIMPIISAEHALFGVYAVSRWRALRGLRNTLKRRPRVATVSFDGDGPLGHKRPASMLLFVF